jgi:hypothetical protein
MVAEGDLINLEEKGRSMKLTSSIPKKKKKQRERKERKTRRRRREAKRRQK